ncbi:MAG: hypothetical protein JW936_03935 [Sedimentisphaerales bacterium]|nr:hypothetical protein [Sedimentisphaerales bacterium]
MSIQQKSKHIFLELKHHAPFTILGAVFGILFMFIFRAITPGKAHILFAIFHPSHVILSAMVTAALFRAHSKQSAFITVLLIGYFGSVGIATLSDCVIPYVGQRVFSLDIPSHAHQHQTTDEQQHEHQTEIAAEHLETPQDDHLAQHHKPTHIHLGFIEEWYIVNPAAIIGIILGYFFPVTRLPHAIHVLISTWASASYLLMSAHTNLDPAHVISILFTLFLAVWLPCCVSDIVFPSIFLKGKSQNCSLCHHH